MRIDLHLGKLGGIALALGLLALVSYLIHHPGWALFFGSLLVLLVAAVVAVQIASMRQQ